MVELKVCNRSQVCNRGIWVNSMGNVELVLNLETLSLEGVCVPLCVCICVCVYKRQRKGEFC